MVLAFWELLSLKRGLLKGLESVWVAHPYSFYEYGEPTVSGMGQGTKQRPLPSRPDLRGGGGGT